MPKLKCKAENCAYNYDWLCRKNFIDVDGVDSKCKEQTCCCSYLNMNDAEKNDVIQDGETQLLGVNVYNGRYYNGYIISYYFVMFEDKICKIKIGDFVIKMKDNTIISKVYKF